MPNISKISTTILLSSILIGVAFTSINFQPINAQATGEQLFVSSSSTGQVLRIDLATGNRTEIARLLIPADGAINPTTGQVYFTELCFGACGSGIKGRITLFNQDGMDKNPVLSSTTLQPGAVSFDAAGNLFFNTRANLDGRIYRIDGGVPGNPPQPVTAFFTTFGQGVLVDNNGNLWGVDETGGRVINFGTSFSPTNNGTVIKSGLVGPKGIAEDSQGRIYVSQVGVDANIIRFNPDGSGEGIFAAGLNQPLFMEFDSQDNLYVVENILQQIIKIAPDGTKTVFASGLPSSPLGLAITPVSVIQVDIDIKPGSDPNCFNNNGNGVIPIAILGSETLDVTQIDSGSVELEGLAVKAVGKSNKLLAHIEDVNGDGFDDLVVQIEDLDGVFEVGDTTATVTGNLLDEFGGTSIEGSDSICITQ